MRAGGAGPGKAPGGPELEPERARPGLALAGELIRAAGPGGRYPGQTDGHVMLSAGRWDATESWVFSQKLAAVREMIRRRPGPGAAARLPGGLPSVWRADLADEIAMELAISVHAAHALADLALALATRLPLTAAALDAGILNPSKARLIATATALLDDEQARAAEAAIAGRWEGATWSRINQLISRAVINADPEAAAKRRERAEREDARVRFFREEAGTCGLGGYALPADDAFLANQALCARARAYRAWGIPGTMEQLRVMAFIDLLAGRDARTRYPRTTPAPRGRGQAGPRQDSPDEDGQDSEPSDTDRNDATLYDDASGSQDPAPDGGDGGADDGNPDGGDGGGADGGTAGPACPCGGSGQPLAASIDLIVPLADLTRYAQQAAQAPVLGALDPDLARRLAAQAARNPASTYQLILTGPDGRAIATGQAIRPRARPAPPPGAPPPPPPAPPPPASPGLAPGQPTPAPQDQPAASPGDQSALPLARFTPAATPGPGVGPGGGGYGAWILEVGGIAHTVRLDAIPVTGPCSHQYQSAGYRPGPVLRRLVQARDGECMAPGCGRLISARGAEFEHAIPWPAGPSCTCNGGLSCHHHNLLKQDRWTVTQHPDGSRTWTSPAGLSYTKYPKEYPT
jgi:hypothetical protein